MVNTHEGPEQVVVPARIIPGEKYTTCSSCKYYSHQMFRSGRITDVWNDICNHPDAERKPGIYDGNLYTNIYGRVITPSWCPYLTNEESGVNGASS